jgi:CRP-like cAMP-binding protein
VISSGNNWLLTALAESSRSALLANAMRIPLRTGDELLAHGEEYRFAYFPDGGLLSVTGPGETEEGRVEIGTIGYDGMFGIPIILGAARSHSSCNVQIEGDAWCVPAQALRSTVANDPELDALLRRYASAWMDQIGFNAVCNAVHTVDQRLARWLLMTHDRVPGDALALTQEFLSVMLGVRRASVTVAAAQLRDRQLIDYSRGRIHILDRDALERSACRCYMLIREAYDDLGVRPHT